ncbi:MAG: hypothetical protein AAF790_15185, partial [Planctomycetota bacterium]
MPTTEATADRRTKPDRRAAADRRRGNDGKHVVLHLGRTEVHLGLLASDAAGAPEVFHTASVVWCEGEERLPQPRAFE